MRCLCDSDLTALIISGQPTLADISEAWANIFAEYVDLNSDPEAIYIMQLQSQIAILYNSITEVETAIYLLRIFFKEELIQVIENNGFSISITLEQKEFDRKSYTESLDCCDEQLAPDRLRLETLSKEYTSYMNSKDGSPADRQHFIKMLRRLARYCNTPVLRPNQFTVEEYVLLFKDYVEYVNANNKQLEAEPEDL